MNTHRSSKGFASRFFTGSAVVALAALSSAVAYGQTAADANSVESVVVTGTIIRGNTGPTGSNLITMSRSQIDDIGAVTVSQALADIPGLNNFGQPAQGGQNSSDPGGAASPTIHSLGNSASNGTLNLIDGHRLPYTGIQHNTVDPSAIPTIALEQIQVLPDGASATYGSDAVAGVINFITRKNFTGLQLQTQYGLASSNYHEFSLGGIGGHAWDGGSAMLAYEYSSKSAVNNDNKAYSTSRLDIADGAIANPTAVFPAISTTPPTGFLTVTPPAGEGTTGPYSTAVPYPSLGSNGQGFNCPIATEKNVGGTTNYLYPYNTTTGIVNNTTPGNGVCDSAKYGTSVPSEVRNTVFMSFKQDLTDTVSVTLDYDYSARYEASTSARGTSSATVFGPGSTKGTPLTYSPTTGAVLTSATTGNQINPFYNVGTTGLSTNSIAIGYDFNQLLAQFPAATNKTGDTVNFATLNVLWDLGHDWTASAGGTVGMDYDFARSENQLCGACVNLALNGTTNSAGTANNTVASSAIIDPQGLSTILSETRALTTSNALDVWDPVAQNKTSQTVLQQLVSGFTNTTATQFLNDYSVNIGGPAFDLPAGSVKVALGGEYIHTTDEQLQNNASGALAPSSVASSTTNLFYKRTEWATFAEILFPLVSPEMNIPLVQKFTLDMSGRLDQYTTYGFTKNPKVGFIWQIVDGLQGRGSYGTSFTVPAFSSGGQNQTGITSQSGVGTGGAPSTPIPFTNTTYNGGAGVAGTWVGSAASCASAGSNPVNAAGNTVAATDPTAVACKINATNDPGLQYAAGGKPGLKPETGLTYSGGFDFDMGKFWDVLDGLAGEVTYYQAKYADLVTSIGLSTAQPGLTYFAPVGGWASTDPFITSRLQGYPLTSTVPATIWSFFDGRQTNAYDLWQGGLDYGVHYSFPSDYGNWTVGVSGNEVIRATQRNDGVNQPLIGIKNGDGLGAGRFTNPEMTWRANLGWNMDPFTVGMGFNFQSATTSSRSTFPFSLASTSTAAGTFHNNPTFTMDLNGSWSIPKDLYAGIGGSKLSMSITNVLNSSPPNSYILGGSGNYGRLVEMTLSKKF